MANGKVNYEATFLGSALDGWVEMAFAFAAFILARSCEDVWAASVLVPVDFELDVALFCWEECDFMGFSRDESSLA